MKRTNTPRNLMRLTIASLSVLAIFGTLAPKNSTPVSDVPRLMVADGSETHGSNPPPPKKGLA